MTGLLLHVIVAKFSKSVAVVVFIGDAEIFLLGVHDLED